MLWFVVSLSSPKLSTYDSNFQKKNLETKDVDPSSLAEKLATKLGGVTILQKGEEDRITNGEEILINKEEGSVRRCGGQGDVLSGLVGTFLAWGKSYQDRVG